MQRGGERRRSAEKRRHRVGRAPAKGGGWSRRKAVDCAGAEQSAINLYFAMPVPSSVLARRCLSHFAGALFPASPALFLFLLRLSLPLFAGAICRTAPALFFVHSRRHPWHCANESAGVTRRGALIMHGGVRRPSAR